MVLLLILLFHVVLGLKVLKARLDQEVLKVLKVLRVSKEIEVLLDAEVHRVL
jgi:dynactin complex subunit